MKIVFCVMGQVRSFNKNNENGNGFAFLVNELRKLGHEVKTYAVKWDTCPQPIYDFDDILVLSDKEYEEKVTHIKVTKVSIPVSHIEEYAKQQATEKEIDVKKRVFSQTYMFFNGAERINAINDDYDILIKWRFDGFVNQSYVKYILGKNFSELLSASDRLRICVGHIESVITNMAKNGDYDICVGNIKMDRNGYIFDDKTLIFSKKYIDTLSSAYDDPVTLCNEVSKMSKYIPNPHSLWTNMITLFGYVCKGDLSNCISGSR